MLDEHKNEADSTESSQEFPETTPESAAEPSAESTPDPSPEPAPEASTEPAAAASTETAPETPPEPEDDGVDHSALDISAFPGAAWASVDPQGRIHFKGTERVPSRVIGTVKGRPALSAFEYLEKRYKQLDARVREIEEQLAATPNKGRFSKRAEGLLDKISKADALGDLDALLARLDTVLVEVRAFQETVKAKKEELCAKAEELKDSDSWGKTSAALRELQQEWKGLGSASPNDDDALWKRFRAAMDHFFNRRDEDRNKRRESQQEAKKRKEELCEQAEAIKESTEWDATAKRQDELMGEWKKAGWAGKEADEQLWQRFREARGVFFDARRAERKQFIVGLEENKAKKDELCEAAEALLESTDIEAACERAKELQRDWKEIGPVPRAVSQSQWQRFRGACDQLFQRASAERRSFRSGGGGRRGQQDDAFSRKREQAESLRESIVRDLGHVERWQKTVETFSGSSEEMRAELEKKIQDVEERMAEKKAKLAELEKEVERERA